MASESPFAVRVPKHNPDCDCGICAYCNGQEDIWGNVRAGDQSTGCTRMEDCEAMCHWSDCKTNPYVARYTQAQMDSAMDAELGRWQEAIRDKFIRDYGVPDSLIDGAGCDSGDPLDFSLAEIGQAANWLIDDKDDLVVSAIATEKERCGKIADAHWKKNAMAASGMGYKEAADAHMARAHEATEIAAEIRNQQKKCTCLERADGIGSMHGHHDEQCALRNQSGEKNSESGK